MNKFIYTLILITITTGQMMAQEIVEDVVNLEQVKSLNTLEIFKAQLLDFNFNNLQTATSFKIKVPGFASHWNKGSKFDSKTRELLRKARKGDTVLIFDIKKEDQNKPQPPLSIKLI